MAQTTGAWSKQPIDSSIIMGNVMEVPLTREQEDLRYLGDRMPFSDAELLKLYRALGQLDAGESFLVDWSLLCGAGNVGVGKIKAAEEQILPAQFGNALYQGSFLPPGDSSMYDSSCSSSNGTVETAKVSAVVDEYTRKARLEIFFEGMAGCSRRGAKAALTVLFSTQTVLKSSSSTAAKDDAPQSARISARLFVEAGYRLSLAAAFMRHDTTDICTFLPASNLAELDSFAKSIVEKGRRRRQRSGMPGTQTTECPLLQQGLVELDDVLEWSDSVAPMFASILPTFFHFVLFPSTPFPQSRTAFDAPFIDSASSFFPNTVSPNLFTVACLSSALTGKYFRLYTSAADGLSFNRLQVAVLGYGGPTLTLIRSTSGGIFGAFTAASWKESKDFYGNTDCFLYQLSPCTAVYRPTGSARNFMYCNSTARSRGYDQQAHGIGFGGTVDEPRLFLAENFDDCCAAPADLTFDNGRLLPEVSATQTNRKYFDIDSLEVWGVGGTDAVEAALLARQASRAVTDEAIRRARKVDKAQFLDDFRAGTFGSKAFQHRQEVDGRADADLDERAQDKDKVYEYAK